MCDEHKKHNRDMWKSIPWKRRAEIERQIKRMPDGIRKQILTMAFIENMSTKDISRYAKANDTMYSRNHKPISTRRIQQIIAEEVPDYNAYQNHKQKYRERKDHYKFIWKHEKTSCAFCGSAELLEWHHMIPVCIGGTTAEQNMVCLCHHCHKAVTDYQKSLFPELFSNKTKQNEEK